MYANYSDQKKIIYFVKANVGLLRNFKPYFGKTTNFIQQLFCQTDSEHYFASSVKASKRKAETTCTVS